jgi:hypothetical protein
VHTIDALFVFEIEFCIRWACPQDAFVGPDHVTLLGAGEALIVLRAETRCAVGMTRLAFLQISVIVFPRWAIWNAQKLRLKVVVQHRVLAR